MQIIEGFNSTASFNAGITLSLLSFILITFITFTPVSSSFLTIVLNGLVINW